MQSLDENKQTIYYALDEGVADVIIGNLKTGQKAIQYSEPVLMKANVSASRGTADIEMFGTDTDYSRTIVTTDMNCPIAETSKLWIGVPTYSKANYRVVAIAKSLNSITYAVKEVK